MRLVVRQRHERRSGQTVVWPLTDSDGIHVVRDRRCLPERRKPVHDLDDLKVILSKMGSD